MKKVIYMQELTINAGLNRVYHSDYGDKSQF